MATTVKNPVHRTGWPAYKSCAGCGQKYTALGLSRHWDKCAKMQERKAGKQ